MTQSEHQNKRHSRHGHNIAVATLVVTAATLVVTGIAGYFAVHSTWQIAETSGSLFTPTVSVGIAGSRLDASEETEIIFGAPTLSDTQNIAIGAVPLTVGNEGTRSLDNVTVTFRFHDLYQRDLLKRLDFEVKSNFNTTEAERVFTESSPFNYSSYRFASLDPGIGAILMEPVFLSETASSFPVPVEFKDGVRATVDVKLDFSTSFLVTTTARDAILQDYKFSMSVTVAPSMNDLILHASRKVIPEKRRNIRNQVNLVQYVGSLIFRNRNKKLFLVREEFQRHDLLDGAIHIATPDPEVAVLEYKPLTWASLFR